MKAESTPEEGGVRDGDDKDRWAAGGSGDGGGEVRTDGSPAISCVAFGARGNCVPMEPHSDPPAATQQSGSRQHQQQ